MSAKRCTICAINWPDMVAYARCPKCDEPTRFNSSEEPLTPEQAQYKRKEIEFDKFYKERGPKPLTRQHQREVDVTIAKAEREHEVLTWLKSIPTLPD